MKPERGQKRLRIALVIEDVGPGGGQERVIAELAPRLARNHEVHLFCFTVSGIDLSGITVHRLRPPPLRQGPRAILFALASSLRIRPGKYDVVLSQGGNTLVQDAALVHTMHRRKQLARAQLRRRSGIGSGWLRVWERVRDRVFVRLERRTALRCRGRLIAISRTVRDYLLREYDLEPGEVQIAANGVDHVTFHPGLREEARAEIRPKLGLGDDDFVVLFMAGRWFEKGLPELIEGLALMEEPARLVVVGRGDAGHFSRLAADLGVAERVNFVPHVDCPQRYFAMADCLVHPDPLEPFGLVTLEAAACGLPLLAAGSGVALDLVEDGVTGFFIERGARSIAEALGRLAADPSLVRSMGDNAHRRSLQFSWDAHARRVEELLLQFAEDGGGDPP